VARHTLIPFFARCDSLGSQKYKEGRIIVEKAKLIDGAGF